MFCVKCGVELTEGTKICPVCATRVYHPDLPVTDASPTYPRKDFESEEFNRRGILFVLTILFSYAAYFLARLVIKIIEKLSSRKGKKKATA